MRAVVVDDLTAFDDARGRTGLGKSPASGMGIPDRYAQERGGWSTPNVMRTVYQHTFSSERLAVDDKVNEYFEKSLNERFERREQNP